MSAILDGKTLKAALYLASATTGPTNTVYTATGNSLQRATTPLAGRR
jgi:hypothetical protein